MIEYDCLKKVDATANVIASEAWGYVPATTRLPSRYREGAHPPRSPPDRKAGARSIVHKYSSYR